LNCRLLYVVFNLGGGIGRQLYYVLETMDRERYRPGVVIWKPAKRDSFYISKLKELAVPVFTFPPGVSGLAKIIQFRQLAKLVRAELVHSYSFFTNFPSVEWDIGHAIDPGRFREKRFSSHQKS